MLAIIIVSLILQGTILPFFTFLKYSPNIALVSLVVIGVFKGRYYGAFFGLAIGLLQDILFQEVIGVYALIYFLIGYGVGVLGEASNYENSIVSALFSGLATILYNFMYFISLYFLSKNISIEIALERIFSLEILYNGLIAIVLHKIYFKVFKMHSLRFTRR